MRSYLFIFVVTLASLSACGNSGSGNWAKTIGSLGNADTDEWPICPSLTFDPKITWPEEEVGPRRSAFKLSLNITSSYEGDRGWSSMANDFDGMGLSLGLLNQPLGQGTLQPLLIRLRDQHYDVLSSSFGAAHLSALTSMLKNWEGTGPTAALAAKDKRLSPLDVYGENLNDSASLMSVSPLAARDSVSASWARSTLYIDGGRTFNAVWKSELEKMAESPEYVAIQIDAAHALHQQALGLYDAVGIGTVRTYLLMFDLVVQNGGLYNSDLNDYYNWARANPSATEKQRLYQIVELRIRHVNPKYVADVRARKGTIIETTGYVHGARRSLETEYCYSSEWVGP